MYTWWRRKKISDCHDSKTKMSCLRGHSPSSVLAFCLPYLVSAGYPCDDHPDTGQSRRRRRAGGPCWTEMDWKNGVEASKMDATADWTMKNMEIEWGDNPEWFGWWVDSCLSLSSRWLWWWLSRTNIFVRWGWNHQAAMLRKAQTPNWPMVLAAARVKLWMFFFGGGNG